MYVCRSLSLSRPLSLALVHVTTIIIMSSPRLLQVFMHQLDVGYEQPINFEQDLFPKLVQPQQHCSQFLHSLAHAVAHAVARSLASVRFLAGWDWRGVYV